MFISWQTHEGFQLAVYSLIEATQFLLQEGMEFVFTEHFCEDFLEEYFGNQRKLGRRNDNPEHLVIVTMQFKGKYQVKFLLSKWKQPNACEDWNPPLDVPSNSHVDPEVK